MPYRIVRFPSVGSTNDIALAAAHAGSPPGLVILADEQVRGKGRKTRDWASPVGGLWASVLLDPAVTQQQAGLLPLAVGCAACQALASSGIGVEAGLRWPNDLMVGDRKLGGILVEARSQQDQLTAVAAGIGINVANPPPVEHATSLADHGVETTPRALLDTLLDRLARYETALSDGDVQLVCERFMAHAWGIDREMLLDGATVTPKEIAVDGALIVEDAKGEVQVVRSGSLRLPGEA